MNKKTLPQKRLWLLLFLLCIEFLLISGLTANTLIYDTNYIKAYSRWHYEPSDKNATALMEAKKRARIRSNGLYGFLLVCIGINTVMIVKIGKNLIKNHETRKQGDQ